MAPVILIHLCTYQDYLWVDVNYIHTSTLHICCKGAFIIFLTNEVQSIQPHELNFKVLNAILVALHVCMYNLYIYCVCTLLYVHHSLVLSFLQRGRRQINVSIWWRINCGVCCSLMDFSKLSLLP